MAMKNLKEMTRREFFAAGAGIAGVAAFSAGARLRGGAPAAGPAAKTKVVLVKTDSSSEGVKKCLDLLKIDPFKGKNVLVKPNFNTSHPTPGSTHIDTLSALLGRIREMGAKSLSIGDRSGPEPTEEVFDKKGIRALAGS